MTGWETPDRPGRKRHRWLRPWLIVFAVAYLGMAVYQAYKPLPAGVSTQAPLRAARDVAFLTDLAQVDEAGDRHSEQAIFDEMLRLIAQARRLVVMDMFMFNDFVGEEGGEYRPLAEQVTQALIRRKDQVLGLEAVVITDPINTMYGGFRPEHFQALRAAGVKIIVTDLTQLRASNPAWSGMWYWCCRWLGNSSERGWLPNLLGSGEVTLRSYLSLLNFKANHRKTLVVDSGPGWVGLVSSANAHAASSRHVNVALRFRGTAALDLLVSERAVAAMSGGEIELDTPVCDDAAASEGPRLQVVTEGEIRNVLLNAVESAGPGDRLDIAVFYLTHRALVDAIMAAQRRGVQLRLLLDPNKDAFGFEKNGIPNRQVAAELHRAGVPLRWCVTQGEQCHSKLLLNRPVNDDAVLILGSANYTRRNLDDLNLETNMRLLADAEHPAINDAAQFFERQWHNRDGQRFSVPYAEHADTSWLRYWLYRAMEFTGLSTF